MIIVRHSVFQHVEDPTMKRGNLHQSHNLLFPTEIQAAMPICSTGIMMRWCDAASIHASPSLPSPGGLHYGTQPTKPNGGIYWGGPANPCAYSRCTGQACYCEQCPIFCLCDYYSRILRILRRLLLFLRNDIYGER